MMDAFIAMVWISVNLALLRVAWGLSCKLYPTDSLLARITHTLVLAVGCILACGTLLGTLGILSGLTFLGIVSIVVLAVWIRIRVPRNPKGFSVSADPPHSSKSSTVSEPFWVGAWCFAFAFFLGHVILGGVGKFPTDWDSLMYHIPLVDHWLQAGNLYTPWCIYWFNPANNELFSL
jgi:hypothetical protein